MTVLQASPLSTNTEIVGRTEPRLWTPPLRELTPDTSIGFDQIGFARDVLNHPLDPWQEWIVIHAGELLPDGRPRFRKVLVLVARQNGKTELLVVLTLYWLFVDQVPLVLGTSTKLDYAVESWRKACRLARRVPALRAEIPVKGGVRKANGEQVLWRADPAEVEADEGSRYKVAASNEEGGRSLTINKLVLDELRQHHSYDAHDASVPATSAVPDAQIWALSNMGSDRSIVLNDMREAALAYIKTGDGDHRLGLFEYSAPPGSSPLDVDALAQANPNLGRRGHGIDLDSLLGDAKTAMEKGGDKLAGFKTEHMCIHVKRMDPAVDPTAWADKCHLPGYISDLSTPIAWCLDVSIDGLHATLAAAAITPDDQVRVAVVQDWAGADCTRQLERDLPKLAREFKPRAFGWFPNGPAASVAAALADSGKAEWPPRDVTVEEIRGEVTAVCMGFAAHVLAGVIVHNNDELLTLHVTAAEKLLQGDAWRFTRKGAGHVDAAYAGAGAVHLARTMPAPIRPRVRTIS